MSWQLALTPSGRLRISTHSDTQAGDSPGSTGRSQATAHPPRRIAGALNECSAAGLFALAAEPLDPSLGPAFAYWRDFAAQYLDSICQVPDGTPLVPDTVAPPTAAELASLVLSVPPMPGAEYVSRDTLSQLWRELDQWFHQQLASSGQGLAEFLAQRAPMWHQVGRVCFHLAENRKDPQHPFAFLATYAAGVAETGKLRYQPLSRALQEYAGAKNKQALVRLLAPIQSARSSSQLVEQLVDSGDIYQPLAWTASDAHAFLREVPRLEASGIVVRLPDWWKKRSRPRVQVTIGDNRQAHLGASGMLDFSARIALGDDELTPEEWRALMEGEEGLVLLRGQWVEVDRDKLREVLDHWQTVERHAQLGLSFAEGMRLLAGAPLDLSDAATEPEHQAWSFVAAGSWLSEVLRQLREPTALDAALPGAELKATLRDYQATGIRWLVFLSELGLGACLADDMGLGKTIQVLGLLLRFKKKRSTPPSLLVLPASLLANWQSEIERFAPSLRVHFVHPSFTKAKRRTTANRSADGPPQRLPRGTDVVITTYGMLLRETWLQDIEWQAVILDEAQAIKNPGARQTRAVKKLRATARIALTGTPVENRLGDLWSLFDFLCPGLLGSSQKFKTFVKSLEARTEDRYQPLRRLVSPYILRRLKTDKHVIADLPEKTEVRAYCGLSKRQVAIYQKLVNDLTASLEGLDGIQRRGLVLSYLTRFKQVCNHPSHLLADGKFAMQDSGKFLRLVELCDEVASRQEKALVFTQFREMTAPLARILAQVFGREGLVLHGGTAVKKRQALVDAFQHDDGPPFFVLSLKAGGTGLNLTAASHVIHFDRWWNPAVENQATDRAFRIGQQRNVLVHKFVCQGTIEQRIDDLITEKQQLAANLLEAGGEKLLTELPDDELIAMVSLDVDRVQ